MILTGAVEENFLKTWRASLFGTGNHINQLVLKYAEEKWAPVEDTLGNLAARSPIITPIRGLN